MRAWRGFDTTSPERLFATWAVVMILLIGLLVYLGGQVVSEIGSSIDEYAKCKADGGETEFCLIGDGS